MNIGVLEDWIEDVGLPPGVKSHCIPARELLTWLQVCCPQQLNGRGYVVLTDI